MSISSAFHAVHIFSSQFTLILALLAALFQVEIFDCSVASGCVRVLLRACVPPSHVFAGNASLLQLLASAFAPSLSCSTPHIQAKHPQLIESGCDDILFEMYHSATADYERARDTLLETQRELRETGKHLREKEIYLARCQQQLHNEKAIPDRN